MKVIHLSEGIGHVQERIELEGKTWRASPFVAEVLERNGCRVTEYMDENDIVLGIWDAWTGDGYQGDPTANGLWIRVEDANG